MPDVPTNERPESRRAPRRRILKGGKIVFNDGQSVIDCTVRNVSETGAQLKVTSVFGIPDAFELRFDDRSLACTIAWRQETALGVHFTLPTT